MSQARFEVLEQLDQLEEIVLEGPGALLRGTLGE